MFHIATDSTADLTPSLSKKLGISVLPLHYILEDVDQLDDGSLSPADFFSMLRQGKKFSTSAVNIDQFLQAFTPPLQANRDILYIGFSSALSGTTPNAFVAANELRRQFPNRKIAVIDTLCASGGEGLLAIWAAQRRDRGETLEATAAWIQETAPRIQHWFTVDDLGHLYRGGRLGAVSALLGTALSIKPILTVTPDGKLINAAKVRGRKTAMNTLLSKLEEKGFDSAVCPELIIGHGDDPESAQILSDEVIARYPQAKPYVLPLGAVIGSHTGPGTLTVIFAGDPR